MKSTVFFILAAIALLPATSRAVEEHHPAEPKSAPATALTDGEIRKIDKETGKMTIKHGPLQNLGMPAMTMVFRVKDAAMLEQVRSGDRIKFLAEKVNGAFTVTRLEIITP